MHELPAWAPTESAETASGTVPLRYEDVTQDGRVALAALPQALGRVVWRELLRSDPVLSAVRQAGIVPILSRLAIAGGGGPVAVGNRLDATGGYELGHSLDTSGAATRLHLNMRAELVGVIARTHGPPPADAGARVEVGQVFAEHVFTRPFAPPGQRSVQRLEVPGCPDVPERRFEFSPPAALLSLPPGAEWLEGSMRLDPMTVCFGLMHTDSNQHVNSLVYPRLFEEAALRRFDELGLPSRVLLRFVDIGYRKPQFAGDRARIALRAYRAGGRHAVAACLVSADVSTPDALAAVLQAGRPHCAARLAFEE